MGVVRSVETRRSLVRSTNGGMTIIADPNGRILAMLEPFVEDFLIGEVPVWNEKTTIYTRWGDWMASAALWMMLIGGLLGAAVLIGRRLRSRLDTEVDR